MSGGRSEIQTPGRGAEHPVVPGLVLGWRGDAVRGRSCVPA